MEETTALSAHEPFKLLRLLASLSDEQLVEVTPYFADIVEAVMATDFLKLQRDTIRQTLGLRRLTNYPVIEELSDIVLPDPTITLADRVSAGHYDYIDDRINSIQLTHSTSIAIGLRQLITVRFGKTTTSSQVKNWAAINSYDLALFCDLLAVGAHPKYKNLQQRRSIVCIGSHTVIDEEKLVPSLGSSGQKRHLRLGFYNGCWVDDCSFLLVRQSATDLPANTQD